MATVFKGPTWNVQELIRVTVTTKRISRTFDFRDLRSGQFCELTITYNVMGKGLNAFYSESTSGILLIISRLSYVRPLSMTHMQDWPNNLSFRSFEVISTMFFFQTHMCCLVHFQQFRRKPLKRFNRLILPEFVLLDQDASTILSKLIN